VRSFLPACSGLRGAAVIAEHFYKDASEIGNASFASEGARAVQVIFHSALRHPS